MKFGKIYRPVNGDGDAVAVLTATISKGTQTMTKTFNVIVKEEGLSDTQCVAADKALLDIIGKDAISGNIQLVYSGANGTTITWSSSSDGIISSTGIVNRPDNGSTEAEVTLTATITKGAVSDTKEIICTVLPWTDIEEVNIAFNDLLFETIRGTNISEQNIISNLNLISTGSRDATITWLASTNSITSAGVVTRPSYNNGDIIFSLTATISVGLEVMTKQFLSLKLVKLPQTNQEAVSTALSTLLESEIKGTNVDLQNVISNLTLPKVPDIGDDASTVTFTYEQKKSGTSNPSTYMSISDSGSSYTANVTRPLSTETNELVDITVTASSSSASGASETGTKVFSIKILKQTI